MARETFGSRNATSLRSSNRRMPSSDSRPPACAGPTCGPTAALTRPPSQPRWATSTAASSKRSPRRPIGQTRPVRRRFIFRLGHPVPHLSGGYQSRCVHSQYVGAGGAQAPRLRVPLADGTLVATPDLPSDELIPSLLATSDVLG